MDQKFCACCYAQLKNNSYTYCYNCNQLPKDITCCITTKNKLNCKLKALKDNEFKCYYHRTKKIDQLSF